MADKKALEGLQQAIHLETNGQQFYMEAAEKTSDPRGKDMFRALAKDEITHLKLVRDQYESLKKTNEWAAGPALKAKPVDLNKPLFPKGKRATEKTVKPDFSEVDALLFAMNIESESYNLYRKAARETASARGKQVYTFLAGEEQSHFDIVMLRYDLVAGPQAWPK